MRSMLEMATFDGVSVQPFDVRYDFVAFNPFVGIIDESLTLSKVIINLLEIGSIWIQLLRLCIFMMLIKYPMRMISQIQCLRRNRI